MKYHKIQFPKIMDSNNKNYKIDSKLQQKNNSTFRKNSKTRKIKYDSNEELHQHTQYSRINCELTQNEDNTRQIPYTNTSFQPNTETTSFPISEHFMNFRWVGIIAHL